MQLSDHYSKGSIAGATISVCPRCASIVVFIAPNVTERGGVPSWVTCVTIGSDGFGCGESLSPIQASQRRVMFTETAGLLLDVAEFGSVLTASEEEE